MLRQWCSSRQYEVTEYIVNPCSYSSLKAVLQSSEGPPNKNRFVIQRSIMCGESQLTLALLQVP